jgi:hypothetical protein
MSRLSTMEKTTEVEFMIEVFVDYVIAFYVSNRFLMRICEIIVCASAMNQGAESSASEKSRDRSPRQRTKEFRSRQLTTGFCSD